MEDLGHIDINIRDMGGAGRGVAAGSPGSGPAPQATAAAVMQPLTAAQQELAQRVAQLRQNILSWATVTARIGTSRIGVAGDSVGELRDFFSRPTIAGFRSLTNNASATGSMLGRLAAGSPRLALLATGLLGAAGVVTAFVRSMKSANEAIKDRITELTKYSSLLASGAAREQIAQLGRDLRELRQNGRLYAAAQRLDTIAANEWAKSMVGINKLLTVFGSGWSLFKIGASGLIRAQMFQMTIPSRLLGMFSTQIGDAFKWAGGKMGELMNSRFRNLLVAIPLLFGQAAGIGTILGIKAGRGDFGKWLTDLLKNLEDINENTRKEDLAGEVNDWFRADVLAMTGRKY